MKSFVCSLCHNGILGGGLYLDSQSLTYKTNKLTVDKKYRNLVLPMQEIKEISWKWIVFPIATVNMKNGELYKKMENYINSLFSINHALQNGFKSILDKYKVSNSRLLNEVQQCIPQWGVQATERSCDSKMEGPRPDKFPFALATNIPVGCLSDRTVLRQQDGGAALRQVRICQTAHANLCLQNDTPLCPGKTGLFAAGCAPKLPQSWSK